MDAGAETGCGTELLLAAIFVGLALFCLLAIGGGAVLP